MVLQTAINDVIFEWLRSLNASLMDLGSVQKVSGLLPKIKIYFRYHFNYLITFKLHSSCIDTLSSARLAHVKDSLELVFRNTVESLCRRQLNHLDGIKPMSFELTFNSWKQENVRWS